MCLQFKNKYSAWHELQIGRIDMTRYNDLRDLTANLLTNICNDVEIEPRLLSVADKNFKIKRQPEVTKPRFV